MEVSGIVKRISDTQQVSANFRKREIVVTTEEQYPQHLSIEFVQDKTDLLNSYQEGEKVNIGINLRGREWTSPQGEVKYFNSIQGWRIEKVNAGPSNPSSGAASPNDFAGGDNGSKPSSTPPSMAPYEEDDDDLPF